METYQGIAAKARPLQNRLSALHLIWQGLDLEYKEKAARQLREMEFNAHQRQSLLQHELKEQQEAAQRTQRQLANFNQPQQLEKPQQVTSTVALEQIFEDSGELY